MKKLVVFDLDGTLTRSKMAIDQEMAKLLEVLLAEKMVAVTGGGTFRQFQKQLLVKLKCLNLFKNLFLFPTNGASFYRYRGGKWQLEYDRLLSLGERRQIIEAFKKTFNKIDYRYPSKTYGKVIEDRGNQVTFSGLGQKAPISKRKEWNRIADRRQEIVAALKGYLPEFDVLVAGVTSIDVIKKGIDKQLAIKEAMKVLKLTKEEVVFVGDALDKGGNDYAATGAGVETRKVAGPEETKEIIKSWL